MINWDGLKSKNPSMIEGIGAFSAVQPKPNDSEDEA